MTKCSTQGELAGPRSEYGTALLTINKKQKLVVYGGFFMVPTNVLISVFKIWFFFCYQKEFGFLRKFIEDIDILDLGERERAKARELF